MGAVTALSGAGPVHLERWFAAQGTPAPVDLARSGAPDLTTADLLDVAGERARDEYLRLPLGYGDPAGTPRLRAAIAGAGLARDPGDVVVTSGAVEALLLAVAAVTAPGERVAVGVPAYGGLVRAVEAAGAAVRAAPVWRPGSARLDLGALCDSVRAGARSAVLNSPHNPTGAVAGPDDIAALASVCLAAGGHVVVDEVAVSTLDPRARSVVTHASFESGGVVTVGDVSKAFGLGGLRIGWLACADRELRRRVAALKDLTTLAPSGPSQFLAALALEHRAVFGPRIAAVAAANRDTLGRWAARATGGAAAPLDGLVAFPRLRGLADARAFARRVRAHAGIGVVPGTLFGSPRSVRIGLGVEPRLFAGALEAIAGALP